jgi:hypothetical protein
MTPQQLRERRAAILDAMLLELSPSNTMILTESEEWLDKLDALDVEYTADAQSAQDAYYAFLVTLDWDYKALKAGQGNTPRLLTAIDHTMSTLSAYAEYLKGAKS